MIGERVRVTAEGDFCGWIGVIRRIVRRGAKQRTIVYWLDIPDHPWSKRDNPLWSFNQREIERVD